MSLQLPPGAGIPLPTVRVARAGSPDGTTAMWIRDRLDHSAGFRQSLDHASSAEDVQADSVA